MNKPINPAAEAFRRRHEKNIAKSAQTQRQVQSESQPRELSAWERAALEHRHEQSSVSARQNMMKPGTKKAVSEFRKEMKSKLPEKQYMEPHGVVWVEAKTDNYKEYLTNTPKQKQFKYGAILDPAFENSTVAEDGGTFYKYYKRAMDEKHAEKLGEKIKSYGIDSVTFRKQRVNPPRRKTVVKKVISRKPVVKKVVRKLAQVKKIVRRSVPKKVRRRI